MKNHRDKWIFLLLIAVGSACYVFFGDLTLNLTKIRLDSPFKDPAFLGWDLWFYSKIHLTGLFLAAMGLVGLILFMRDAKLIT